MRFEPIAIVGRGTVLPGGLSPEALWNSVYDKRDLTQNAPSGRWRLSDENALCSPENILSEYSWSKRGGYVQGFSSIFTPDEDSATLDPLFHWVLHCAQSALKDVQTYQKERTGLIMGNLSFPSSSMSHYAETVWFPQLRPEKIDPRNRFMSGFPILWAASKLGLSGPSFALDAACASALYAIKLACDRLHRREADVMLAGAVNRADDLFLHVGFCSLKALSPTGQSRPFHADADGLLPAEGAGVVALKRLSDARKAGERVLGVIRGVGLSNDGRGKGLLVPSSAGQQRAMEKAYAMSGIDPNLVGLLECHATGTPIGDATELRSMAKIFSKPIGIGSLKSNMGHLITAAGVAGLMKVLSAMEHRTRPASLHVEKKNPVLSEVPFRVLSEHEVWNESLIAGISAFGFGGNNAHLIVEAESDDSFVPAPVVDEEVVIVGMEVSLGNLHDTAAFADCVLSRKEYDPKMREIEVSLKGLRFPPSALSRSLGQQNVLFSLARRAVDGLELSGETGVWIGMGTDPNVARYGARWRLRDWRRSQGASAEWFQDAQKAIISDLTSEGVLGAMPNIPANRINQQLDAFGGSSTVSAEEGSGMVAFDIAANALRCGELDCAVVGAVDMSAEVVHKKALEEVSGKSKGEDGAVVFILKRRADAERLGEPIFAVVGAESPQEWSGKAMGYSHAAYGLLQVAAAVVELNQKTGQYRVAISSLGGGESEVVLRSPDSFQHFSTKANEGKTLSFAAHLPAITLPTLGETMIPAPSLPSSEELEHLQRQLDNQIPPVSQHNVATVVHAGLPKEYFVAMEQQYAAISEQHRFFLQQQESLHQRFLAHRAHLRDILLQSERGQVTTDIRVPIPSRPDPSPRKPQSKPKPPLAELPKKTSTPAAPITGNDVGHVVKPAAPLPTGLSLSREELKVHASGDISSIYGPLFQEQDRYAVQTRMPEPPLLLADRVVGLDAEPVSMGKGTIWTETDVCDDSWYLHQGRMPAGVMIESGQADLMLISYLGIDLLCKGERSYRLLGCELQYHDELPAVGDTLCYDIHVDGHAKHGNVRLFFFHYDCRINGKPRLTVRKGQAGFFTKEELAESAGILWKAEEQELAPNPTLDAPLVEVTAKTFTREEIRSFAKGEPWKCFGSSHMRTMTHTRTPRIQSGKMLFLQSDIRFEPYGGPWKRGYLRTEVEISGKEWFFDGHFKNDPCMPGTLMFEGCLQAMAFYMAALGFTIDRDGWCFQPLRNRPYPLYCRGQVTPASKKLLYEVFVEEICSGPEPYLVADLLCTVDGLGAFHARGMGLELVPDYPLRTMPQLLDVPDKRPCAIDKNGMPFNYKAMIASALGQPSQAFGLMYTPFDSPKRVARLPGPPYHFMSRVRSVEGELGTCTMGTKIELEYDIPPQAWYFSKNGYPVMPFAVFLEAALQPCGWLASAVGSALTVEEELFFRNLDGRGTLHQEVFPTSGILTTKVELTNISRSGGMIIESFAVECWVDSVLYYTLQTVFGFFPKVALENQVGLPTSPTQRRELEDGTYSLDLRSRPERYFSGSAKLPEPMLCMLDRITAMDLDRENPFLRGEKTVDPSEWFFKAHFFQDPVQPGSLGIEAMIQLLQFYMLHVGMHTDMKEPRFQPLATEKEMVWKYRGQVLPENRLISTTMEITETGTDSIGIYAVANASLWVDGKRIYEANGIGMRLVDTQ